MSKTLIYVSTGKQSCCQLGGISSHEAIHFSADHFARRLTLSLAKRLMSSISSSPRSSMSPQTTSFVRPPAQVGFSRLSIREPSSSALTAAFQSPWMSPIAMTRDTTASDVDEDEDEGRNGSEAGEAPRR